MEQQISVHEQAERARAAFAACASIIDLMVQHPEQAARLQHAVRASMAVLRAMAVGLSHDEVIEELRKELDTPPG